jgi:hypothetical protein
VQEYEAFLVTAEQFGHRDVPDGRGGRRRTVFSDQDGLQGEDLAQELLAALRDAPLTVSTDSLLSKLSSRVNSISPDDMSEIVPAILSLYSLRAQLGSSTPDVAESIAHAMEESDADEPGFTGEERDRFESRLIALLSLDSLRG